jgi:EAL domain-containing protein (putative c-di-GMP-specific phosphodiesterase class I)
MQARRSAWRQCAEHDQREPSSKQLAHPDLSRRSTRFARDWLGCLRLKLEITESSFMDDLDAAIAMLRQLQPWASSCMDDFGMGIFVELPLPSTSRHVEN